MKWKPFWLMLLVGLLSGTAAQAREGILDYNRFMRDIEPLLTTTTYTSPGPAPMTCFACHGDPANAAYSAFPLKSGESRFNFTQVGRAVELDEPETSLILIKPL